MSKVTRFLDFAEACALAAASSRGISPVIRKAVNELMSNLGLEDAAPAAVLFARSRRNGLPRPGSGDSFLGGSWGMGSALRVLAMIDFGFGTGANSR